MSRMEDVNNEEKEEGWKEGWHHRIREVALFGLTLCQAIFKGKQVGDWKG